MQVRVETCTDAFACLRNGDREGHDELVRDAYEALPSDVELVVLARRSCSPIISKSSSFRREYQKLTRVRAAEGVDHIGYLFRLAEMIERDCRKVERRDNLLPLAPAARARRMLRSVSAWPPARGACPSASPRPPHSSAT
ncbi:unnamed protein product [Ciceribacter sp. T2.26MG-112.2]|nr:unnamed protein product [Ciceribacter naphthalenivorans]